MRNGKRYILGIESSCDETAASVVSDTGEILSNVIYSQITEHKAFNGVVPEIAARAHLEKVDAVVEKALSDAGFTRISSDNTAISSVTPTPNSSGISNPLNQFNLGDLDAIAATCGPGLIGGVIVGASFAKGLAIASNLPFIAVNHIEAHALTVRLTEPDIEFPYLLLLASGGHCQICIVHDSDNFEVLGRTLDDSVGETFDKVAKMLGLGYPGGPMIEKFAKNGDETRFELPKPLCSKSSLDFSFSGLKTAVRLLAEKILGADFSSNNTGNKANNDQIDGNTINTNTINSNAADIIDNSTPHNQDIADICASFQRTVADILVYKMRSAFNYCKSRNIPISTAVIAGGVAANQYIRKRLDALCVGRGVRFSVPPIRLCTDNGAMIAWTGMEKLHKGQFDTLDFKPRPRWELSSPQK